MIEYIFSAGGLYVKVRVEDKEILICSDKTMDKFINIKSLFNSRKMNKLNSLLDKMNQKEFDTYIVHEFKKMGYILKSKNVT